MKTYCRRAEALNKLHRLNEAEADCVSSAHLGQLMGN